MSRLDLAARRYLGTPFRHQGRDPAIGIDCIGLLVVAARDCGMWQADKDSTSYGKDPSFGLLESHMAALFGAPIAPSSIQPGDIAAIDYRGAVRHVGIVAEHPKGMSLIHTNMAAGEVTEARIDEKWLARIKRAYRPESV